MKDRLGNHIQQVRGVSYKPSDLSENLSDGYTVLLRANNISEGRINFDSVQFVRNNKISQEQILKTNDILVCSSSGSISLVGKSALYKKSGEHTFGAFCKVVRATGKLHPQFIAFYMCSQAYRKHIEHIANGANINNLRNEHLDEIQLDIPTDDQQKVIISKLEKIQSIITHRRTQLSKLDELIKCRFVEMFGDSQCSYSQIQSIAEDVFAGGDKPKDTIKTKDTSHPYPVFANGELNQGLQGYSRLCRVDKKAITVSARGTIGYCCIRDAGFTPIVRLITLIPKPNINLTYLSEAIKFIGVGASGAVQAQLTVPDFKKIKIPLPSINSQITFASFVRRIDKFKFAYLLLSAYHRGTRCENHFVFFIPFVREKGFIFSPAAF